MLKYDKNVDVTIQILIQQFICLGFQFKICSCSFKYLLYYTWIYLKCIYTVVLYYVVTVYLTFYSINLYDHFAWIYEKSKENQYMWCHVPSLPLLIHLHTLFAIVRYVSLELPLFCCWLSQNRKEEWFCTMEEGLDLLSDKDSSDSDKEDLVWRLYVMCCYRECMRRI